MSETTIHSCTPVQIEGGNNRAGSDGLLYFIEV